MGPSYCLVSFFVFRRRKKFLQVWKKNEGEYMIQGLKYSGRGPDFRLEGRSGLRRRQNLLIRLQITVGRTFGADALVKNERVASSIMSAHTARLHLKLGT